MTAIDGTSMRTDLCGRLGPEDAGRTVAVCGWVDRRREHSEHLAFVDLRDHSGVVQCVVDGARDLRSEYVVRITGTLRLRPEGTANPALATGEVELHNCEVELLSRAEPPPFPLDERTEVDEILRLRHRYVDLRKPRMQRNLRARAAVNRAIRRAMDAPGLRRGRDPDAHRLHSRGGPRLRGPVPQGARLVLCPSPEPADLQAADHGGRGRPLLPDRPLPARRGPAADRQFEFSQLDVEASFVERDDVLGFVTTAVAEATMEVAGHDPGQFDRMTWHEAMERFGSDKPDIRFGMELAELTPIFADTKARVFQAACVKGICLTGGADTLPRSRVDELVATCQRWGAKGLAWMRVVTAEAGGSALDAGVAKFLSAAEAAGVIEALDARPGDMVFLVADERPVVRHVLGLLRLELGRPPVNDGSFNFLWVLDFPLFEGLGADGAPIPSHHPFTMPHIDDLPLLMSTDGPPSGEALLDLRSQAYDLVLNGWELGSGSVRIHRRDVQQRIFEVLGITPDEAQERFGFLLDAFRYGAPPTPASRWVWTAWPPCWWGRRTSAR